jgi:vacuolar-type H+-ATPase subunit E/Vma4
MDLEQTLEKIVENASEELHVVRKRAEEKTAARDHGKEYHEAQAAADRLDRYAHEVRRLHDAEYQSGWRDESLGLETEG